MAREEIAERMPDRGRLDQAGRKLVEQRLEGVVVVPVDEDDLGVGVLELLRRTDPGEPAAEDQDARTSVTCHLDLPLPRAAARSPSCSRWTRPARDGSPSRPSGTRSADTSSAPRPGRAWRRQGASRPCTA